jgi:phosphatidylserine/phosphatidylglycerophosphate/cardiolipin synthase-like enzyme
MLLFLLAPGLVESDQALDCRVSPKFSSHDSIAQAVVEAVRQTRNRITLALYGFNNKELADELARLAKKNVVVRLKLDTAKSSEKKTARLIETLKASGVHVQAVAPDGRNHNKFAVIDGTRVLTGSYNWTEKAESNWENLLILDCAELAQSYEKEWEKIH